MEKAEFINRSLLLRYEAFSKFATEVTRSNTFDDLGVVLASHIKFVLDTFLGRILFANAEDAVAVTYGRGTYQLSFDRNDILTGTDKLSLSHEIPQVFTPADIRLHPHLQQGLFAHPKITYLFILPLEKTTDRSVLLQIASKNERPFSETDFRFARLLGEFLTTKFSQLFLGERLVSKNQALEDANEKLTALNEQVKSLNAGLETVVVQRTQRLMEAQQELNTLFYRTSHDFRRPLASILGLANLIELTREREEIARLLQFQKKSISELNIMLDKLQTINLTETDHREEAVDFVKLMGELKKKFDQSLPENHVRFQYTIKTKRKMYTHTAVLFAILENLIENAIRYRKNTPAYVKLVVARQQNTTLLTVTDNGEGIAPKYQSRVFDMYFRGSERAQGNGLGLYIVKKLVDKL